MQLIEMDYESDSIKSVDLLIVALNYLLLGRQIFQDAKRLGKLMTMSA
ncbi:MAG: hypothetical protein ACMUEM_00510 [Flavobacteriales bacterium AspAUS03]